MSVIVHAFSEAFGQWSWTKCGIRSTLQPPVVVGDVPTCVWCAAGRQVSALWQGPVADIIEENSVKDMQEEIDDALMYSIVVRSNREP